MPGCCRGAAGPASPSPVAWRPGLCGQGFLSQEWPSPGSARGQRSPFVHLAPLGFWTNFHSRKEDASFVLSLPAFVYRWGNGGRV